MNELQQILLVFAVIVVVGLYFFSRQRNPNQDKSVDTLSSTDDEVVDDFDQTASAEKVNPTKPLHRRAIADENPTASQDSQKPIVPLDEVPEAQTKLPFGDEFELQAPNHPVLEIDEMIPEGDAYAFAKSTLNTPDPQVFAILVLTSGKEFNLVNVAKILKSAGLGYCDKGSFVKKHNEKVYLRVANVMEPGTFPAEIIDTQTTPGVVLILELPCVIQAEKAMDDLIMTARRVSQNLKGRMYDMQRHLIRESDLQAMRESALDYHSKTL